MSTPNIEELRQLAQAATPGVWCHVQRGISRWHGERIEADLNPICDFAMLQDCCVHEYDRAYENAAYIQAANPAAIIGLIDTIQAQAERIKELEGQLVALEADYAETRDELQEANDSLASTYHILGERDAQLAAIAATEPVKASAVLHPLRTWKDPLSAWWHCRSSWGVGGQGLSEAEAITNWADKNPKEAARLGLFTRPMPVQPIIDKAKSVASHYFDIEGNLYTANRAKFLRPSLNGLTPLFTRPMPVQPDWLLKSTQDLANSIRRRCFPEVPQFEVLGDLAGVISQIDNMTCGMVREPAQDVTEVDTALGALLFAIDTQCGNGTAPWEIEDAYSEYTTALSKYKGAK